MTEAVAVAAPAVAVGGVIIGMCALVVTRDLGAALPITLDFLMAAGLLRLATTQTWQAIATAAAILLIRKVVSLGLTVTMRAGGHLV